MELSAPEGPIKDKYSLFVMLGEPGYPKHYREVWTMGDVGTAKTSAAMDAIILSAVNYPGSQNLVTREFKSYLMSSTWNTFNTRAKDLIKAGFFEWVDSKDMFRAKNGSNIYFLGLDRAEDRMFGEEWFRAAVDQGERIKEARIDMLHSRMRQKVNHKDGSLGSNWIKLTGNWDKGRGYPYRRVVSGGRLIAPDIYAKQITAIVGGEHITAHRLMIHSRIEENKSLTRDYLEHLVLAGDLSRRVAGGKYQDEEGVIFLEYQQDAQLSKVDYLDSNIIVGLDYGLAHPTVAVFAAVGIDGHCQILRDYVKTDDTVAGYAWDIGRIMVELERLGGKNFYVYGDRTMWRRDDDLSIATKFAEQFSKLPVEVSFAPAVRDVAGSVDRGINDIKEGLRYGTLKIAVDTAPNVASMLQSITYEDVRKDRSPIVDIFDATRYLVMNAELARDQEETEETPVRGWAW